MENGHGHGGFRRPTLLIILVAFIPILLFFAVNSCLIPIPHGYGHGHGHGHGVVVLTKTTAHALSPAIHGAPTASDTGFVSRS